MLRSCQRGRLHAPNRAHGAPGTAVLLALVAAGLGVAVVPASVRALPLQGVVFRDLVDAASIELALAWRAESTTRSYAPSRCSRQPACSPTSALTPSATEATDENHCGSRRSRSPSPTPSRSSSPAVRFTPPNTCWCASTPTTVSSAIAEAPPRPFTYGETQAGIVAVIDQIFAPQSSA